MGGRDPCARPEGSAEGWGQSGLDFKGNPLSTHFTSGRDLGYLASGSCLLLSIAVQLGKLRLGGQSLPAVSSRISASFPSPRAPVPQLLVFQGSGPIYCKTELWAAVASCLGKGLYEAETLASPGLLDFFTDASDHERPWQLTLDQGVGVGP